jgi:stage II sporulation protein D
MNFFSYKVILLALFAAVILAGCFGGEPQKKPDVTQTPAANLSAEPEITVFMHKTNEVKPMKIEEYIKGVVAGEMKNDWPIEALAAQAIIARTFTLESIESKGGVPSRNADASTDVKEFQAYNAENINDKVQKAVEMTRGLVMIYENAPAKTWFHSSAGGMTATAKEGLNYRQNEPPYIQAVKSPDELAPEDIQKWRVEFPQEAVLAALNKQGVETDGITVMEISEKGPSGRAVSLLVNGSLKVSAPDFRVALDSFKLKSMLLDKIEVSGHNIVFSGRGYGHGVGMSQWGAHQLAKSGKNSEQIISHYFKDVALQKKWQ